MTICDVVMLECCFDDHQVCFGVSIDPLVNQG